MGPKELSRRAEGVILGTKILKGNYEALHPFQSTRNSLTLLIYY